MQRLEALELPRAYSGRRVPVSAWSSLWQSLVCTACGSYSSKLLYSARKSFAEPGLCAAAISLLAAALFELETAEEVSQVPLFLFPTALDMHRRLQCCLKCPVLASPCHTELALDKTLSRQQLHYAV